MSIHSKFFALSAFIALSQALFAGPSPSLTLRSGTAPKVDVEWVDATESWALETSPDLIQWAHLDALGYERPSDGSFRFTDAASRTNFYRMRKLGSSSVYVIGDSISTPGSWPKPFATKIKRPVFSQAIGGTMSPSMVARARGVELVAPSPTPTVSGTVRMKWRRYLADRTDDESYRTAWWKSYVKAVSEPTQIEVYQHGRLMGFAQRILKSFSTNYATAPKTITSPAHGLANGDRIAFISNDPNYPSDLSVLDTDARWNFSSPSLPSAIIERRVYFVANATTNTFELKEYKNSAVTLDLKSNATGSPSIECGWIYDLKFDGGAWDVTWKSRTQYDDRLWLFEVSANDIPAYSVTAYTIPNTYALIQQMTEINPRYIIICPPSGSFSHADNASTDRGPGSFNWKNYYEVYMPWVKATFPDNYIDTMALLNAQRTAKELSYLANPNTPERVWLSNSSLPNDSGTWQVYKVATADTTESWIGPGYTPLQFRAAFNDGIHLSAAANTVLIQAIYDMIIQKGW